jgi:hypothetical protein
MATTKFDPFRKTGGTIELVRDANTGAYSTKTVGFADLPVFNLPQLGVVEVTDDAATTKKKADEALKTQTSSAFQSGGGGGGDPNRFLLPVDDDDGKVFSDAITKTAIENQEAQEKAAGIGIKTPEIKTPDVFMGEFAGTGPDRGMRDEGVLVGDESAVDLGEMKTTAIDTSKVPSRNDLTNIQRRQLAKDRNISIGGVTYTASQIDKATIDRGAAFPDDRFGEFGATVGTTPIAGEFAGTGPDRGDQTLGIRADPTEATGAAAVTQASGPFDPRFRDQAASLGISAEPSATRIAKEADFASGIPERRNIFEKAIDSFKDGSATLKIAKTGLMIGGQIATAIGDTILGVTAVDKRRRELDTAAAKSLGFRTRGELGASTDPGRIAMSPADHVLGGKNRDAALGNLSESGAKRIQRRMTTGLAAVEKRHGKDSKEVRDYKEKTKTFQNQMNKFNTEKEKKRKEQAQNPNLRSGAGREGGGTSGGKIVCTMMNESYGFGSFRNKIWMKFHKDISPEYQKGYHKLFLPLVRYAKQKGITNKFIKNILEHIAVHSTIDMRQSLRGKRHTLGRVYRKIILPLCYWAGKK